MNNEVMQEYTKRVIITILAVIMLSASAAAITFSLLKLFHLYPTVSWTLLAFFVAVIVVEDIVGVVLIRKASSYEELPDYYVKNVKIYFLFLIILNLNLITWFFPSRESWMFVFYFLILMAFFLDLKIIIVSAVLEALSVLALFAFNPVTRPDDTLFGSDAILRTICISLSLFGVIALIYFVNAFLLHAKSEQIEANNARVQNVLQRVTHIAGKLGNASSELVNASQSESASTEELSVISEELIKSSAAMLEQSEASKENLAQLQDTSQSMELKMQDVENITRELVGMSESNQKALSDLTGMSAEVEKSTRQTREVTDRLLAETGEIGKTLNIINEIAESTNLLALNASIEAARAGEAGRGFAVVAQEVGTLAANTKDSLSSVNSVIVRVQNGAQEVSAFMNQNAQQLRKQNEVIAETVQGIRTMIEQLRSSVAAVEQAVEMHTVQAKVISETISISERIADGIKSENEEFGNIAGMAQGNAAEISTITDQAGSIDEMVNELEKLLES